MRILFTVLFLVVSTAAALADCATPSGYTRWGSGNWRISETMPSAPIWERLPSTVPGDVSQNIKDLGRMSTGIAIHVESDTDTLRLCWDNSAGTAAYSITSQTGVSGIDVYYRSATTSGQWRWLDVGEAVAASSNIKTIALGFSEDREFLIYLPQFRRLGLMRIETPSTYTLSAGPVPTNDPLVVYGSSIVQGSGTSRAGIAYPQALGRHFDVDAINLGFAGSCQMFEGMATLLATIDASAFIIDCFPNMTAAQVTAQMYDFIDILATAHPTVPIYIVQDRLNQAGGPHPSTVSTWNAKETAALAELADLQLIHSNLIWVPGDDLLGDDFEGTVDGSHPSDLGQHRYFLALRDSID